MIRVLTNSCTFNPAKAIADIINESTPCKVTTHPEYIKRGEGVFRYGCGSPHLGIDYGNKPAFIGLAGNKLSFSRLLLANNILTPEFNNSTQPTEFPVVIRDTLNGMGGAGIHFASNMDEYNRFYSISKYWTKFYPCEFELRIHILGGQLTRIFKKVKEDEDTYPIRNSQNGYHYSLCNLDNYPKVSALVGTLNTFIEGEYYALDLGWCSSIKKYVVFEANSAPGLNGETAKMYAEYMLNQIRG